MRQPGNYQWETATNCDNHKKPDILQHLQIQSIFATRNAEKEALAEDDVIIV